MSKRCKHIFSLGVIFILSVVPGLALGIEVTLPGLPAKPDLADYIAALFNLAMGVAGGITLLSFIYGAFRYMTSAGNPEKMSDGKDRMLGSIFGMVLLLSSYLILTQINPQIIFTDLAPWPELPGVFLRYSTEKSIGAPTIVYDTNDLKEDNVIPQIEYRCESDRPNLPLLVFFYDGERLENFNKVVEISCGNSTSIIGRSYEMRFKTSGVYLYREGGCPSDGYRSDSYTTSAGILGEFDKDVRSIEIVNDTSEDQFWGAVLHGEPYFRGQCSSDVYINIDQDRDCFTVSPFASSITVFQWNPYWGSAGDGVKFFSRAHGKGGYHTVGDSEIDPWAFIDLADIDFDYTGTEVSPEERESCRTFDDCPGSIRMTGNYLVFIYALRPDGVTIDCAPYDSEVTRLKEKEWIHQEGRSPYKALIMPIVK